ncbi:MAG: GTPase Era [Bacteroidetes bacterium]|nr:GTPase Era [Bacteroidota bacterium]
MSIEVPPGHRAGFVALLGKPNVGKSTLLNALLGTRLAIVTPKAQTTRHRILGVLSQPDYQIVFSDTPGVIRPQYGLHHSMMKAAGSSLQDADAVLLLVAPEETHDEEPLRQLLGTVQAPIVLVVNKADAYSQAQILQRVADWQALQPARVVVVSALQHTGLDHLLAALLELLPLAPPYYDKDTLTDRPERFFVAEIIREQVFLHTQKEIPYSSEVSILFFRDDDGTGRAHIEAEIHVERQSQKGIVIGKQGQMIRQIGTDARQEIQSLLGRPVRLELYVRVAEDWKNKTGYLRRFGYDT